MSEIIQKIKETIRAVNDKYYVEVSYVETAGKAIPELLDKDYVVYDSTSLATDFTKDPKKATCFDYTMGALIVSRLKEEFLGDPNIQAAMVSVADALFINDITGVVKGAMDLALTPQEKANMAVAEEKTKELHDKISRLEGLIGISAVIIAEGGVKVPTIEINVANIESKAKLFTLKSDAEETPFLNQNAGGKTFYNGVPVKIVMLPTQKAL
jgi:hypothetical protein